MSLTCGFFNSVDGDRKYNAEQMSEIFNGIINDGVFMSIGDHLAVTEATGMFINVGTGRAWFNGTWTNLDSDLLLELDQSEIAFDRIDMIVLEINHSDNVRTNSIKVIKGTPGITPEAPTLTNTDLIHQYPLAQISVVAGTTHITTDKITNKIGSAPTVFVTGILDTIDTTTLIAEWQAEFELWITDVQQALSNNQDTFDNTMAAWLAAHNLAMSSRSTEFSNAMIAWDNEFDVWFAGLQEILNESVAGNLLTLINQANTNINVLGKRIRRGQIPR